MFLFTYYTIYNIIQYNFFGNGVVNVNAKKSMVLGRKVAFSILFKLCAVSNRRQMPKKKKH